MCNYYLCMFILLTFVNEYYSFVTLRLPISGTTKYSSTSLNAILKNNHSYYNKNKVISNYTNNIQSIYTTYDHKNSIIIYMNGNIEKCFNRTLKLKSTQDIIQLNIVSISYFRRLYQDLQFILQNGKTNDTTMQS